RPRGLRQATKTRVALGDGCQSLFRTNRVAEPGPQGIAGVDQARRFEKIGGDQIADRSSVRCLNEFRIATPGTTALRQRTLQHGSLITFVYSLRLPLARSAPAR